MRQIAAVLSLLAAFNVFAYTADELAAKNVEAKGGSERLNAIHTLRLSGKMRVNGDTIELAMVTLVERPASIRYEAELQGLTQDLVPTIPALANLTNQTIPLMRDQVRPASSCVVQNVIPWSNLQINDSNFNASNGFPPHPAYVEDLQLLPGLAGESRTFDANGPIIRLLFGGGTFTYSLNLGGVPTFGSLLQPLEGVQPVPPPNDQRPPLAGGDAPNAPCETQAPLTSLDSPEGPPPAQVHPATSSPVLLPLQQTATKVAGAQIANALKATGSSLKVGGAWASPATQQSSSTGSSSGASNSSSGGGGSSSGAASSSSKTARTAK